MSTRAATCVWRISNELVAALDRQLGDPVDAYVNGSQTWLRDDGPGEITIEWRLHPVANYRKPDAIDSHHDVFTEIALAVSAGGTPIVAVADLWDGLEAFAAYGDEVEPQPLATALTAVIGIAPDATGLVDHTAIGDAWERTGGTMSVVAELFAQLEPPT